MVTIDQSQQFLVKVAPMTSSLCQMSDIHAQGVIDEILLNVLVMSETTWTLFKLV